MCNLDKELEQTIFQIIASSGESRVKAFEAFEAFQAGDFEKRTKFLKEADELASNANKLLFNLVHREAKGEKIPISILLLHACDILMNAITTRELIERLTTNPKE